MDLHLILVRKLKEAYKRTIKNPKVEVHFSRKGYQGGGFGDKTVEVDAQEELPELPEQLASKFLYFLQSARQLTKSALEQVPDSEAENQEASFWKRCSLPGEVCRCSGLVRLAIGPLGAGADMVAFTPATAVAGIIFCNRSSFPKAPQASVTQNNKNKSSSIDQRWCDCLPEHPAASDFRAHLALLDREFAGIFCEVDTGCSEELVSMPLSTSKPYSGAPVKATDEPVTSDRKSQLSIQYLVVVVAVVIGLVFLSWVVCRYIGHGTVQD